MFLSILPSISLCAPLWASQYLLCHVYSMDHREYLLSHEAPPFPHLLTSDPSLLFLTLFFFPTLPVQFFFPFLNCVSQRCHQLGRCAQLCWITRSSSGNGCAWHRAHKPALQPAPSYNIAMVATSCAMVVCFNGYALVCSNLFVFDLPSPLLSSHPLFPFFHFISFITVLGRLVFNAKLKPVLLFSTFFLWKCLGNVPWSSFQVN